MTVEWHETEPEAPPRPKPWWRRALRRVLKTFLLIALGVAVSFGIRHYRAVTKLEEAVAALDQAEPGWRLKDVEAARDKVPEAKNSAPVVVAAAGLMPRGWPSNEFAERLGKAVPPEQLDPAAFALLCKELDAARPALQEARKLADRPNGRHRLTFQRNVMAIMLPDQQETRKVTQLLTYDAMRQAQAGDLKQAMLSCRAAVNAGRSLGDEPLLISQLIRIACVAAACSATERTLSQGEPPADELLALQRLLQHESAFPALLVAMRGERGMMHEMLDALESGDVRLSELEGGLRSGSVRWQEWLFGWWIRDAFRADHPRALALMTRRIKEVQLPPREQIAAEKVFDAEVRALPPKEALATRLLLPAVTKVASAERRRLGHVRSMIAALAAERYRQAHGAWPKALGELVPEQLTEVPSDPIDGEPLRYRRLADGVVIYSVGEDGQDDGGKVRAEENRLPADVGVRLWDVKQRRQPPRPPEKPPAPPELPGGPD